MNDYKALAEEGRDAEKLAWEPEPGRPFLIQHDDKFSYIPPVMTRASCGACGGEWESPDPQVTEEMHSEHHCAPATPEPEIIEWYHALSHFGAILVRWAGIVAIVYLVIAGSGGLPFPWTF